MADYWVVPYEVFHIEVPYKYWTVLSHSSLSHDGALLILKRISNRVPQGSVLELLPYLLYTADISSLKVTVLGAFADDTVIETKDKSQPKSAEKTSDWTQPLYQMNYDLEITT